MHFMQRVLLVSLGITRATLKGCFCDECVLDDDITNVGLPALNCSQGLLDAAFARSPACAQPLQLPSSLTRVISICRNGIKEPEEECDCDPLDEECKVCCSDLCTRERKPSCQRVPSKTFFYVLTASVAGLAIVAAVVVIWIIDSKRRRRSSSSSQRPVSVARASSVVSRKGVASKSKRLR